MANNDRWVIELAPALRGKQFEKRVDEPIRKLARKLFAQFTAATPQRHVKKACALILEKNRVRNI